MNLKWYCYIVVMLFIICITRDTLPKVPEHPYPYPAVIFYENPNYTGERLVVSPGIIKDLSKIRKSSGGTWAGCIKSHRLYPALEDTYINGVLPVSIYVYSQPNFDGSAKELKYVKDSSKWENAASCYDWINIGEGFLGLQGNWSNKAQSLDIRISGYNVEVNSIIYEN